MVAKREVPLEDIILLRESIPEGKLDPTSIYPDVCWDHLTLYDQGGTILKRSRAYSENVHIRTEYQGLTFIASPGYDGNETISVEWRSMLRKAEE